MRLRPSNIFVPLIVVLVVTTLLALHSAAEAPCSEPDHARKAGELETAETGYVKILEHEPGNDCAAMGLRLTDGASCARARVVMKQNRLETALKLFTEMVDRRPDIGCASAGRAAIRDKLCERARAMKAGGAGQQARKTYEAILAEELPERSVSAGGSEGRQGARRRDAQGREARFGRRGARRGRSPGTDRPAWCARRPR